MSNSASASSSTSIAIGKLRELIFSGQLGAGTDHLESELATQLGMSRTPVREALLRLETQGLLEVRPRKGVRITTLSRNDVAEIYDVLMELESLAVESAANRNLKNSDLTTLNNAIETMDQALAEDNRENWADADDIFHAELTRIGNNCRARHIAEMMSDQLRRAHLVTLYIWPVPLKSNDDHLEIVNAIRAGDADQARKVLRHHRQKAKIDFLALLERHHLSNL
jgi:DNA-binding GntR family transcriptional regulator